jgi:hypothetical protein
MSDATETGAGCPLHVPPEDVAAWTVDGEPSAVADLETHLADCAACRDVAASAAAGRDVGERLRAAPAASAPRTEVVELAMGRVRAERGAWLLARTLGGALARVVAAAADLAGPAEARRRASAAEDTGELPRAEQDTGELPRSERPEV